MERLGRSGSSRNGGRAYIVWDYLFLCVKLEWFIRNGQIRRSGWRYIGLSDCLGNCKTRQPHGSGFCNRGHCSVLRDVLRIRTGIPNTSDDTYTFCIWAILTLPFALASRNLAHWTVWLVILIVASTAYSNSGLRLAGNHIASNIRNIAVSGGLIVALIVLDKILSPRLVWARAEWFRILLVLAVIGFSFIGFTESFWDTGHGLWLLSLGLICGLLAYLYYLKASLGTLALASFGVFILVAQFAFKLFEHADAFEGIVGIFFLQFIWMGGLTLGLDKAFRHFLTLPSSRLSIEASKADDDGIRFVMSLTEFFGQTGLAESEVSKMLASDV